jgi:hypothetical protein
LRHINATGLLITETIGYIFPNTNIESFELLPRLIGKNGINITNWSRSKSVIIQIREKYTKILPQPWKTKINSNVPLIMLLNCKDIDGLKICKEEIENYLKMLNQHFVRYWWKTFSNKDIPPLFRTVEILDLTNLQ